MSYEKTNWKKGDIITAEKMNKIESGIESASDSSSGGGGMIVDFIYVDESMYMKYFKSTTLGEDIISAYTSGTPVIFHFPEVQDFGVVETYESVIFCNPLGAQDSSNTIMVFKWASSLNSGSYNQPIQEVTVDDDGYVHAMFYVD